MATKDTKQLARSLYLAGSKLSEHFQSRNEVLNTLKRVEECLILVKQSPPILLQISFAPIVTTLSQHRWLKHADGEVRLLVTTSFMEIIRISTPQEPYEDNVMKEVLQLVVDSFQYLGDIRAHYFPRRVAILKVFAKIRLSNIMLDLGLYDLIHTMFQHFLVTIKGEHNEDVIAAMKASMVIAINESDAHFQPLMHMLLPF
ncbi:hypothetical protein SUGI_0760860 [Cryptomeria japonica]|nr:hypothetical protein SUGI_0760860 [Cryptomeria japonica]